MRLNDCVRGDLVVIEWPKGSDYSLGKFGDVALRGTEQLVVYLGPSGKPASRKASPPDARVHLCDAETHEEIPRGLRFVENVEVAEVVERRHVRVDGEGSGGDASDPLAGRVRPDR
jgi:hypothetical protein